MANLLANACIALVKNGISYLLISCLCNFWPQRYELFLIYAKKIAKFLRNGDFFCRCWVLGYRFWGVGRRDGKECRLYRSQHQCQCKKNARKGIFFCVCQKKVVPLHNFSNLALLAQGLKQLKTSNNPNKIENHEETFPLSFCSSRRMDDERSLHQFYRR